MRLPFLLCCAALLAAPARAQAPAAPRPLVVMNLAAHPDDEDGLTMAYYRYAQNAVVHSVIFTRGEGGQNEIGPELYERLGSIRTAETEAAARILGTEVHYLNFYDFGFSKHAAETFAEWSRPRRGFWDTAMPVVSAEAGRAEVTARLVRLIREVRPDVLFTNHDTSTAWPRAQHGHHQAVGIAAYDAVALAADPAYRPGEGGAPWQVRRLFVRQFRPTGRHDVAVPVSDACGVHEGRLESCATRAVRAVAEHRSQGFDVFAARFHRDTTYFTLLRAAPGTPPLSPRATDLAEGLPPNPHAAAQAAAFRHAALAGRRAPLPGLEARYELAMPGSALPVRWTPGPGTVTFSGAAEGTFDREEGYALLRVSPEAALTAPAYRFQYGRETAAPPIAYTAEGPGGPWAGFVAVEVVPPAVVRLPPSPVRLEPGTNEVPFTLEVHTPEASEVQIGLQVVAAESGEVVHRQSGGVAAQDAEAFFRFTLPRTVAPGPYRVDVRAAAGTGPVYQETRPGAVLPRVGVAPGLRVGFVRSYDGATEAALRAMGATVVPLSDQDLAAGRFDGLHTIVLDIRAYLARPALRQHNGRLLAWVAGGGHLVVGYHKSFEWNEGSEGEPFGETVDVPPGGFAPYPLWLGRDRVTREDAPVTVLAPEHRLFTFPHRITEADWDGWVQERGLYFPQVYDDRYREMIVTGDPGEEPLRSGLLLARVGRGTYVYSPLVWYRQLDALAPGAWRLFANLVSLPLAEPE
ncbi:MAG: PIG-L deacetylase family protein [Rubricoccaceae bacterium]